MRLAATVLCLLALGCPKKVAGPDLAPRLLHDEAEMAAYLEAFPSGDYQVFEVPGLGRFYLDDNPAAVKKALREGRPWEPHLIEEFRKHVVPGSTVLDVGAHIGSLTVPIARLVGPEGRVYAFEPQKRIFRELVKNLELNGITNAIPLRFAVSSEPGIIEMDPAFGPDGKVSIGRGGDRAESRTIDSIGFTDVSVIKIDVEGHEAWVLRGATETIRAWHPVILLEVWDHHLTLVEPILEGLGYSMTPLKRIDYVAVYTGP